MGRSGSYHSQRLSAITSFILTGQAICNISFQVVQSLLFKMVALDIKHFNYYKCQGQKLLVRLRFKHD